MDDSCPEDSPDDSDGDDDLELDIDIDHNTPQDPLRDVRDVVDLLYRFALTLRNPAGHSRIRDALSSSAIAYHPYDVRHIQSKYPVADQWLIERLARATSARRQFIRYREDHYDKKASEGEAEDGATTLATSLPGPGEGADSIARETFDETRSTYSQTSYATSVSGTTSLRPPRLPEAGIDERPFQCDICYSIVSFDGERSWR